MSKPKLRAHDLYMGRPLKPEQGETPANGFHPEPPPQPLLKDTEIESDTYRLGLLDNEGDISVVVEAGDELGQIRVSLQFEGPKGKYNACLSKQGELLENARQWIEEIYKPFKGEFVMDMISNPCPKGDSSLLRIAEKVVRKTNMGVTRKPTVKRVT